MWTINERLGNDADFYRMIISRLKFEIRCVAPGIIKKFDADKQTVNVQLVIREKLPIDGKMVSHKIPELGDVPIFMPRAGNFILTMPIKVGDECLVCFSDTCFDAWWQSGGEENEQMAGRRHDLSDGFALCGVWSQKKLVDNYSEDSAQLRSLDGASIIEITDDEINIKTSNPINIESEGITNVKGSTVNVEAEEVNLGGSSGVKKLMIQDMMDIFNDHTHQYIPGVSGSAVSGIPAVPLVEDIHTTIITKAK